MIFCVEDDAAIRDLMLYTLTSAGFEAEGFSESTALWAALAEKTPELIMLDLMLPGEDGISILKKIRSQTATADIPIILATAKGTEYDKVFGLDLGQALRHDGDDQPCEGGAAPGRTAEKGTDAARG